ncbi:MAG: hypothetical protein J6S67_01765 [Methanobrevibacter sp.]|nr:hypothetical protein [Methanobrevibacter sp.]
MAISKKNKMLQCAIPKEDYEHLETIVEAFKENGVPCNKGHIVTTALRGYEKLLVANGLALEESKNKKVEEPLGERKDA